MKWVINFSFFLSLSLFNCSKDTETGVPASPAVQVTDTNACLATGVIYDSLLYNARLYKIKCSSGSGNSILVEFVGSNSHDTSIVVDLTYLQALKADNCFQNNAKIELVGPQTKVYLFHNFPTWAIDTNTALIAKVRIDSSIFYLKDPKFNK